jgi:geranylgeranyl diphosphate synthase, type II
VEQKPLEDNQNMYSQSELKELVEKAISNLSYASEASKLIEPVKYFLSIGGKRLRPVMTLMSCNLFCDKIDDALLPAIGLEIFHNYTLIHDDIMDMAVMRRNSPTVHSKWGLNQAILSGDVMSSIAAEYIAAAPLPMLPKVLKIYNRTAIDVCLGQQLDMDFEKTTYITQAEYLRMIELKTAVLVAASIKIGSIIGGGTEKDVDYMSEFGRNLGLSFQIQDDLLDVYGDMSSFGKRTGGDIVTNKKTFLLLKALEMASGEQLKLLQLQLSLKDFDPEEKIRIVTEIFNQLDIRQITETLANEFINKATSSLDKVNADQERKSELYNLVSVLDGRSK